MHAALLLSSANYYYSLLTLQTHFDNHVKLAYACRKVSHNLYSFILVIWR